MTMPTATPPRAIPKEAMVFISHPSLDAALGASLEPDPPAPLDPDGEDEEGTETCVVGEGVKTPPEGSWAIHDDAAVAASSAVLGPACQYVFSSLQRGLTVGAERGISVKVTTRINGVEFVVCTEDVG